MLNPSVVKVLEKRKKNSNNDVQVKEVIHEIKRTHFIGVIWGIPSKARNIAKKDVQGDASKKYHMLWSYAGNLNRANPRYSPSFIRGLDCW